MIQTWEEMLQWQSRMRQILKEKGLDAPSRRSVSYNTSERCMRRSFGGRRVPAWAEEARGSVGR